MHRRLRALSPLLLRAVAVALLLAFVEIVALAAQPAWHERAHDHAHAHDHEQQGHPSEEQCAVTLLASGAWLDAACGPVVVPVLAMLSDEAVLERQRIAASFRFSGILEHAPPRRRI
jgi:hypothetical protein